MSNWPLWQASFVPISPISGARFSYNPNADTSLFGAWMELRASGPALESLSLHAASPAYTYAHHQIGIGPAENVVPIIDHYVARGQPQDGAGNNANAGSQVAYGMQRYPVRVADGARLWARVRSTNALLAHSLQINGTASSGFATVGYGSARFLTDPNAATVFAAAVTSGNPSYGAWVLIGTLPYDCRAVSIVFAPEAASWPQAVFSAVQLGVLAGALPVPITTHHASARFNDFPVRAIGDVQPIALPAGTALYARYTTFYRLNTLSTARIGVQVYR